MFAAFQCMEDVVKGSLLVEQVIVSVAGFDQEPVFCADYAIADSGFQGLGQGKCVFHGNGSRG